MCSFHLIVYVSKFLVNDVKFSKGKVSQIIFILENDILSSIIRL